jgi:hypothetical protein
VLRKVLRRFVKDPSRQAYIVDHPIALSLALGAILVGALILTHPFFPLATPSGAVALLPIVGRELWGLAYFAGGVFSTFGILRGSARSEAAGWVLVATALLVAIIASLVYAGPGALVGGAYVVSLGAGLLARAWLLATRV